MTGLGTSQGIGRRFALMLIALAMLVRIAVPSGWMPQANGAGLTLSWCADSGMLNGSAMAKAEALLADATGKQKQPDQKPSDHHPCAFAAAAQPLTPVSADLLPAPSPAAEAVAATAYQTFPGRGLAAPPPLSTGPPLLA